MLGGILSFTVFNLCLYANCYAWGYTSINVFPVGPLQAIPTSGPASQAFRTQVAVPVAKHLSYLSNAMMYHLVLPYLRVHFSDCWITSPKFHSCICNSSPERPIKKLQRFKRYICHDIMGLVFDLPTPLQRMTSPGRLSDKLQKNTP